MGTDETTPKQLFMINGVDLVPILGLDEAPDFNAGDSLNGQRINFEPRTVKFEMRFPKNLRCRSRKRFIKLLMSRGFSRNDAEREACFWQLFEMPYQIALLKYVFGGEGGRE